LLKPVTMTLSHRAEDVEGHGVAVSRGNLDDVVVVEHTDDVRLRAELYLDRAIMLNTVTTICDSVSLSLSLDEYFSASGSVTFSCHFP
jgi:hypothetical protein